MQMRGTFPELNAGQKKSAKRTNHTGKFRKADTSGVNFGVPGKGPRVPTGNVPKGFKARRDAAHAKAYRKF